MNSLQPLAELADQEFDGESFNGPSLMKTLASLSPEAAASTATWEGYSAWEVALHLAYFKHFILRSLLGDEVAGVFPLPKGKDGFGKPLRGDAAEWKDLLDYLGQVHRRTWAALREASEARLAETLPRWGISFARAGAWLATHDSYHVAQIRSMGVPGLKEAKEG